MRTTTLPIALLLTIPLSAFTCEPEVGTPCSDNTLHVDENVDVAPGTDNLVSDVTMENCTQALCLSSDGSRPYCTIECESDGACPTGEGFRCVETAPFATNGPQRVCAGTPAIIEARDEAMGRLE